MTMEQKKIQTVGLSASIAWYITSVQKEVVSA